MAASSDCVMGKTLSVDIWSDVACPWCYVGKRRFEAALQRFDHRDHVRLTWHAFELDPSAPAQQPQGVSYVRRLADKYRSSEAHAQSMIDNLTAQAAKDGIAMDFVRIRPGNTFDAHRVLHWAHSFGKQDELKETLLRAYFCEAQLVSDHEVLVDAAKGAGLDEQAALAVLQSGAHAADVRADEQTARQLGINGVPFFVIGGYGVSGAQASDTLLQVLDRAWQELPEAAADAASDVAPACGPDGC